MFNGDQAEVELICDNDAMDSIIDRFGEDITKYASDKTSFRAIANIAVAMYIIAGYLVLERKLKLKLQKM